MCCVQNLDVITDETRYNWDFKRTFADRAVRYSWMLQSYYRKTFTDVSNEINSFICSHEQFTVYQSSLVKYCCVGVFEKLSCVQVVLCHPFQWRSVDMDVASRCSLHNWRWALHQVTADLQNSEDAFMVSHPVYRYCRVRYTSGRTHQLIRYEVLQEWMLSLHSSLTRYSAACQKTANVLQWPAASIFRLEEFSAGPSDKFGLILQITLYLVKVNLLN
jgi:hypothetical protein